MREILFRGKSVDYGEWVEGFYSGESCKAPWSPATKEANIIQQGTLYWYEIIPETVGQYTSLTDKNGTKIFEGDIVTTKYGRLCEVRWLVTPRSQCWDLFPIEDRHKVPDEYDLWIPKNLEVIGNIYDNPELMEGRQ